MRVCETKSDVIWFWYVSVAVFGIVNREIVILHLILMVEQKGLVLIGKSLLLLLL